MSTAKNNIYNEQAEQELLGLLILDNNYFDYIVDTFNETFFYFEAHQHVFLSIRDIIVQGKGIADIRSVYRNIKNKKVLEECGGEDYMSHLIQVATIAIVGFKSNADLIQDCFLKRKSLAVIEKLQSTDDIKEAFVFAEKELFSLLENTSNKKSITPITAFTAQLQERLKNIKNNAEAYIGLPTGFKDLDSFMDGLHNSDLIILAARPSMGKTALAVNISYNIARYLHEVKKSDGGIGFFSLEMSGEQIASRLLTMNAGIDSKILRTGKNSEGNKMNDKEYAEIIEAMSNLSMLPIYIDDTSGIDIESVKIRARHMKIRHNIQFLVIDYLQLIRAGSRKNDGRVQEISEITQSLKAIAKDLNIPVIALSQLSRDVEKRDDKKPQLSDLRESGSIEQDADIVMFLYREHYYHERMKPRLDLLEEGQEFSEGYYYAIKQEFEMASDNREYAERVLGQLEKYYTWWKKAKEIEKLTEVIVAKNRHGAIGTIRLGFAKEQTKFFNFSSNEYLNQENATPKIEHNSPSPLNEELAKELENIF